MIQSVVEEIKQAQNIILTTHRQCDGDGLGSELAMYFALKKVGKNVRIINVDGTPAKYSYLSPDDHIQYFDGNYDPIQSSDLALIFDTNDKRLVEPLYDQLSEKCKKIIFVDHHPVLKNGPTPTDNSIINIHAASTGELAYDIITALDIDLDAEIARSLYTSVVFDTQLFRYVRNSPRSHEICAELLKYEKAPSEVHKKLFGNFTAAKLKFVAQSLSHIEFSHNERIALLLIKTKDLEAMGLNVDDSRDIIDMIMNIESVETAAVFREDADNEYKLSLRSKGIFPILEIAETVGGGGHPYASGASLRGNYTELKDQILQALEEKVKNHSK